MALPTTPSVPGPPGGATGGGLIGAIKQFNMSLGEMVSASQEAAAAVEESASKAKKAARDLDEAAAQVDNASTLDRMGPESTNNTGSSSSTAAVLADVTAGLQQQAGRR